MTCKKIKIRTWQRCHQNQQLNTTLRCLYCYVLPQPNITNYIYYIQHILIYPNVQYLYTDLWVEMAKIPLTWIPITSLECNFYFIIALSKYVFVIRNPEINYLTRTYVAIRTSGCLRFVKNITVDSKYQKF